MWWHTYLWVGHFVYTAIFFLVGTGLLIWVIGEAINKKDGWFIFFGLLGVALVFIMGWLHWEIGRGLRSRTRWCLRLYQILMKSLVVIGMLVIILALYALGSGSPEVEPLEWVERLV